MKTHRWEDVVNDGSISDEWVTADVAQSLYDELHNTLECLISIHDDPEVINAFKCHYDMNDLQQAYNALAKARGETQ